MPASNGDSNRDFLNSPTPTQEPVAQESGESPNRFRSGASNLRRETGGLVQRRQCPDGEGLFWITTAHLKPRKFDVFALSDDTHGHLVFVWESFLSSRQYLPRNKLAGHQPSKCHHPREGEVHATDYLAQVIQQ